MNAARLLERAVGANASCRYRDAVRLCDVALNLRPSDELEAELRLERASALAQTGKWTRAERDCRSALGVRESARGRMLLARCKLERGAAAEALAEINAARALDPDTSVEWRLHARALSGAGRHEPAAELARHARESGEVEGLKTLVAVLAAGGRHEELILLLRERVAVAPHDVDSWTSLGLSHNALGQSDEAVTALRHAVTLDPLRRDAGYGLAVALLRLGHFEEGFFYHEYRQRDPRGIWRFGVRDWKGESLASSRLLVLAEQGYGDVIQFARFVPWARRLAKELVFLVPPSLEQVFRSNPELDVVSTTHPGFGTADCQALLLSLPHLLGAGDDLATSSLPLVFPEPERRERWLKLLPPGPKIAFAWQGNPDYAGDRWRSMPLAYFEPLFESSRPDVTWLSLQKRFGREQLLAMPPRTNVVDLGGVIDEDGAAFVDSLAVLSCVDLFITTDTALAHLAGSAGIPTWLLLSYAAEWRWGIGCQTSAWYPGMRLFRTPGWGDWSALIRGVHAELEAHPVSYGECRSASRCNSSF